MMVAFELTDLRQVLREVLLRLLPHINAVLLAAIFLVQLLLNSEEEIAELRHLLESLDVLDVFEAAHCTFKEECSAHCLRFELLLQAYINEVLATEST